MSGQQSDSPSPDSLSKIQLAIHSLASIVSSLPPSLSSAADPALALLHDPLSAALVSAHLRSPDSGVGDDPLCRWLYDTFHSSHPALRLVVLRFLPTLAGVYLSRVPLRRPLAGFEAVLLALYAHETTARDGHSITVTVPDLANPSIYHDAAVLAPPPSSPATPLASAAASSNLHIGVLSPALEPHGTVRSARRARIVGVALELYCSKIVQMPVGSKIDFCDFCRTWAGLDGEMYKDGDGDGDYCEPSGEGEERREGEVQGRIPLPWELLRPALRILGHCLVGAGDGNGGGEVRQAAGKACRSLHARAVHDVNPRAILATQSLLRVGKISMADARAGWDPTEIPSTTVISL